MAAALFLNLEVSMNELIDMLDRRVKDGENGQSLVPLLAALATAFERSDKPAWHDNARRLRAGIQSISRGGTYGGFIPDRVPA